MNAKIKEILLSVFLKKRNFVVVLFATIGISFPLFFVDGLASTIGSYTASAITGVFFLVTATASLVFATFADWFLRISLSPDFISIPYTTGNEFVSYGWSIVRDFVNMFFIIVLIIIGLSTSLQIETYRWQKTLPRLVAVALLINFTPVFLGIFIDAANMMMNYFVSSVAQESIFVVRMRGLYDVMASNLANAPWTSFTGGVITPVAMAIIFTLFNIFTGIVYGLYGLLFAMRYVVIWLLVIISPFGFFCYILPATQPFFRQWWKWFIGWCIAGVAAAFFLYLGEIMFQYIDQEAMIPASTEHQGMEIGMFIRTFPLMIPLLFILFGFLATLSVSASSAKGIVMGVQGFSGAAKKSSFKLSGSTIGEKTQSAGAAVRNAFSPSAPSSSLSGDSTGSPSSSSSLGSKNMGSTGTGSASMRRRGGMSAQSSTSYQGGPQGTTSPIAQTNSFASQGTVSAAESIASEIASMENAPIDKKATLPERDEVVKRTSRSIGEDPSQSSDSPYSSNTDNTVNKNTIKCKECGASISKDATTCPLCKKKITPSSK